jgi:hypothetical protein
VSIFTFNVRPIATATLLTGSLFLFGAESADGADAPIYGINYDVVKTDNGLVANCKADSNATVHQKFIVPRYGSAIMQKAVREELAGMRKSGYETIRSIVQLYPGANSSGDLVNSQQIDDSLLAAIGSYVRDVRDAGFGELILAFGMQGTADPACRKSEWGDCFDLMSISTSVEAEAKIIHAAQSVTGITLRVDLLNEACVSNSVPRIAKTNFALFIRSAAKMHATAFPNIPATVSCQLERAGDGLALTQGLFAESGDHIGYFDIHAYPQSNRREPEILGQAAKSLKSANIPIIFGETIYADPHYRNWVVTAYREAFHGDPQEILFWPLRSTATHCNFDVAQPYTLKDALGSERAE